MDERLINIKENMEMIKYKIVIISGKGGVGKSLMAGLAAVGLSH